MKHIALTLWLAGCGTSSQSTTPFVRDLHFSGPVLAVENCRLDYKVDQREGTRVAAGVAQVMLLPLIVFGGGGAAVGDPGPSHELAASGCTVDHTVIPDVVAP